MTRLFGLIIAIIWWLWIVVATTSVAMLTGLVLAYFVFENYYFQFAVFFAISGVVPGILWAEKVRTRIGLDKFFGTIEGAPTKYQSMRREDY